MLMPSIFGESLIDELFEDFARPVKKVARMYTPASTVMKTDIKETETGYDLMIDLPGYKKDEIQAQLKDGYLTISASTKKNEEAKDEDGKFIRKERYVGSCSRSYYVGEEIEQGDIKAKFEDGILKVNVPKKEPKPKVEEKQLITIEG